MSANFTIYRRGVAAFKLESRRQGDVRKVTQASYREEIMADDSIKVTLLSTKRMDFKLRDCIFYEGRPYLLNTVPEATVDDSKRYTYKLSFEGAMFELGRVAFIMENAFGYDYYGTLPEFARLVVDNMNRINMWVEWRYQNVLYKAKFKRIEEVSHGSGNEMVTKLLYMWGIGFNGDMEGIGENFIYTEGLPTVGGHATSPDEWSWDGNEWVLDPIDGITVTAIHKWSLDFPHNTETPAQYTVPSHIPDNEYSYEWCDVQDAAYEDYRGIITDYETAGTWQESEGSLDYGVTCELVSDSIVEGAVPSPGSSAPTGPTDSDVVLQEISFRLKYQRWHEDTQGGGGVVVDNEYTESIKISRRVTYTPVETSETSWQVEPITPPSGTPVDEDFPTGSQLISYDQHSCLAVMQDLANKWTDWEWQTKDITTAFVNGENLVCGTIKFQRRDPIPNGMVHIMGHGKRGGLSTIHCKYADEGNVPSRIYFYGGTQNLPEYYRNTRLCLPNYTKDKSYIEFSELLNNEGAELFPLGLSNATCEEVITFDEIYPANEPFVIKNDWPDPIVVTDLVSGYHYFQLEIPVGEFFDLTGKWANYDGRWPEDLDPPSSAGISPDNPQDWVNYPDFCEWLVFAQVEDFWIDGEGRVNRNRYRHFYMDKPKYLTNESAKFIFQTGDLAGYSLSVHSFERIHTEEEEFYRILLNVVNESNEEISDYHVPNNKVYAWHGDKFIVDNINMPVSYTYYNGGDQYENNVLVHHDYSAEYALLKAALDYMTATAAKMDYEIEVTREYVIRTGDKFHTFERVQFDDPFYGGTESQRINAVELDLVDGYRYKITTTNGRLFRIMHNLAVAIQQTER